MMLRMKFFTSLMTSIHRKFHTKKCEFFATFSCPENRVFLGPSKTVQARCVPKNTTPSVQNYFAAQKYCLFVPRITNLCDFVKTPPLSSPNSSFPFSSLPLSVPLSSIFFSLYSTTSARFSLSSQKFCC